MPPAQLHRALPPPHMKAMCAQLCLAPVRGCSRTRWEGFEGEAWPCWVGKEGPELWASGSW